jgi:hypothetical protein
MSGHDVRWKPPRPEATGTAAAIRRKPASGDVYAGIVVLLLVACTIVALFDLYLLYGGAH